MEGFVYLIQMENTDLYKVGITRGDPYKRIKSLQTANPNKLILTDFFKSKFFIKIETILHRQFSHKKYQADNFDNLLGEWFEFDLKDIVNFKKNCQIIEKNLKTLQENSTLYNL